MLTTKPVLSPPPPGGPPLIASGVAEPPRPARPVGQSGGTAGKVLWLLLVVFAAGWWSWGRIGGPPAWPTLRVALAGPERSAVVPVLPPDLATLSIPRGAADYLALAGGIALLWSLYCSWSSRCGAVAATTWAVFSGLTLGPAAAILEAAAPGVLVHAVCFGVWVVGTVWLSRLEPLLPPRAASAVMTVVAGGVVYHFWSQISGSPAPGLFGMHPVLASFMTGVLCANMISEDFARGRLWVGGDYSWHDCSWHDCSWHVAFNIARSCVGAGVFGLCGVTCEPVRCLVRTRFDRPPGR